MPTATQMFLNVFGLSNSTTTTSYAANIDSTLIPYNPLEPGRFRIIRDFKMNVAPGWRSDTFRKLTVIQSRLASKGRVYFGPKSYTPTYEGT